MSEISRIRHGLTLVVALLILPSAVSATQVITGLSADAEWHRVVGATNQDVTDLQVASETGVLAPLSVSSSALIALSGTVFESVSVSFASLNQGTFVYDVGWDIFTPAATSDEVGFGLSFGPFSGYGFTLMTPGSLTVNWSDALLVGASKFLTHSFEVFIDGGAPTFLSLNDSGTFVVPLGIGVHTLDLLDHDFGIYSGATFALIEDKTTVGFVIDGTVDNMASVPEPATLLLLGSGLVALAGTAARRTLRRG